MDGIRLRYFLLCALLTLCGCADRRSHAAAEEVLPKAPGAQYQLSLARYHEADGIICQPFSIHAKYPNRPSFELLFAEQADDVEIAQTPKIIYLFYNQLALTHFSATGRSPDARVVPCDINVPICANERKRLMNERVLLRRICGSSAFDQ